MHTKYVKADRLSRIVIGAAIEVQRQKGAGLIESIYELLRTISKKGNMSHGSQRCRPTIILRGLRDLERARLGGRAGV